MLFRSSGIVKFACPVLDENKKLIGALGSFAPAFRCPQHKQKDIIKTLVNIAEELSVELSE